MRTLMTVLTTCLFALPLTAAAVDEPVKKAAVRELDVKHVYFNTGGQVDKPIVFASAKELMTKLDVCVKGGRHRLEERITEVDFEREKVLYFNWAGSPQDKLTYEVKCCPKHPDDVTGVRFQCQRDLTSHGYPNFRMIVLPKNTPWSVADQKKKAE